MIIQAPKSTFAADTMFFDSTNHYLGACQLTNKAEWELKENNYVTKFEVWYNWSQGETEIPVKIQLDNQKFAEFTATRGDCDPYQRQWCNAVYSINKDFPQGKYKAEIPNSRMCLKPGETGTIRLYKSAETSTPTSSSAPTPTATPITPSPTTIITQLPTTPTQAPIQVINNTCSCTKNIILASSATSGLVSLVIWFILKKIS